MSHRTLVSNSAAVQAPVPAIPASPLAFDHELEVTDELPPPLIRARLLRVQPFMEAFPDVARMLERFDPEGRPYALCLAVRRRLFPGLLYPDYDLKPEEVPGTLPFFVLPAEYEPYLPALVTGEPCVCNWPTVDLRHSVTYVMWGASLPGQPGEQSDSTLGVWMNDMVFSGMVYTDDDCSVRPHPGVFQPVMMMAGGTVAVGGFWKTSVLSDGLGAAGICSQSHIPEDHYSEAELKAAARRAMRTGLMPWSSQLWEDDSSTWKRQVFTEPVPYDFREWGMGGKESSGEADCAD